MKTFSEVDCFHKENLHPSIVHLKTSTVSRFYVSIFSFINIQWTRHEWLRCLIFLLQLFLPLQRKMKILLLLNLTEKIIFFRYHRWTQNVNKNIVDIYETLNRLDWFAVCIASRFLPHKDLFQTNFHEWFIAF